MYGQIDAQDEEQYRAYVAEPFLEGLQVTGQFADTNRTIAYQPRNQHNRQTCAETENHRHQPVPAARKRQRDINHRQEIDESVRTESDGKENTEDEGP